MAFHRERLWAVRLETSRHVVVAHAIRVEPVFEGRAPTAVSEHSSVPHTLERRNFVVAGASASLHRKVGIGPYGEGQNVEACGRVSRHAEAVRRSQLVARI